MLAIPNRGQIGEPEPSIDLSVVDLPARARTRGANGEHHFGATTTTTRTMRTSIHTHLKS